MMIGLPPLGTQRQALLAGQRSPGGWLRRTLVPGCLKPDRFNAVTKFSSFFLPFFSSSARTECVFVP